MSASPSFSRRSRPILAALLLLALPWLWFSMDYTLHSGWDSDVFRQWVTSRYVHEGIDPYRVSYEALYANYGSTHGADRMRLGEFKIYQVSPRLNVDGVEGVLPAYGPPTATYPPSCLLPIAYTVGFLPQSAVVPVWLVVNLALLGWMIWLLSRRFGLGLLAVAVLTLWWPPVHDAIRASQFGFLVMGFVLVALAAMPRRDLAAGTWLSLALIKPSFSLPFLIIPFVKGKWRTFVVIALLHGVATLVLCARISSSPWSALHHWTEIPRYMLQGAYSIQEVVNRLGIENTTLGTVFTLGFVGITMLWCLLHRKAGAKSMLLFLCYLSVLWTYHERYDFVVLLAPVVALSAALIAGRADRLVWGWSIGLVVTGLALTDLAYLTDHALLRQVRWAGRLALLVCFALAAWEVRRDHFGRGVVFRDEVA